MAFCFYSFVSHFVPPSNNCLITIWKITCAWTQPKLAHSMKLCGTHLKFNTLTFFWWYLGISTICNCHWDADTCGIRQYGYLCCLLIHMGLNLLVLSHECWCTSDPVAFSIASWFIWGSTCWYCHLHNVTYGNQLAVILLHYKTYGNNTLASSPKTMMHIMFLNLLILPLVYWYHICYSTDILTCITLIHSIWTDSLIHLPSDCLYACWYNMFALDYIWCTTPYPQLISWVDISGIQLITCVLEFNIIYGHAIWDAIHRHVTMTFLGWNKHTV